MARVGGVGTGPVIKLEGLSKTWGNRRGVEALTFAVEAGEVFGFLGPNGAGKTTTIRALMGFVRPSAGNARIFGRDCWRESSRIHADVGFLAGDVSLYGHLTGFELLHLLGRLRGLEHPPRLQEIAERLELDLQARVSQLSKGNRQKVALVAAFMHDPSVLVLDEPTSGLDPIMQRAFLDLIRDEHQRGCTVLLSSHLVHEVERVCTRVAIIREGQLVAVDSVAALRARSPRRLTATFVDEPAAALLTLPDAPVIERDGKRIVFAVSGQLGPLLERLAPLRIDELSYGPPDLEAIFAGYYHTGTESGR